MPRDPSGGLPGLAGIGTLRSLVTLYRRDQTPDNDTALVEQLIPIATVHADIQPTYASTFWETTAVDQPVSHMITCRWLNYPGTIDVIARSDNRPDTGAMRTELYRVRRTKEIGGRKRFLQMECELEHSRITPDDSDATRSDMLTEPYTPPEATP